MRANKNDSAMERARGNVYAFFSALLLDPPTPEILARVLCSNGVAAMETLFPDHPDTCRLRELAEDYQKSKWQADDFLLDYEALFRIPGDVYIHPFESVYCQGGLPRKRGGGTMLLGTQAREIAAIYREEGLAPNEGVSEFPDHLGIELGFIAALCRKRADALDRGKEDKAASLFFRQRSFFMDHLIKWCPECLDRMIKNATTRLYTSLAGLLRTFVVEEQTRIAEEAWGGSSALPGSMGPQPVRQRDGACPSEEEGGDVNNRVTRPRRHEVFSAAKAGEKGD